MEKIWTLQRTNIITSKVITGLKKIITVNKKIMYKMK